MPYDVPDDATTEEIASITTAAASPKPAQEPPPQRGSYSPLSIGGEFASAANRGVMDTLDFLGPGTINAGLRLAGSDYQMPTFAGGFNQIPGSAGGFMPEGAGRDVVRAAGTTLPAAASLTPVAGRSLASGRGALEELLGFGTQKAPTASVTASQAPGAYG